MIKMAVYGLVRVLVEWLGELPTWYGVVVVVVGGASAVIGVVYAIFQHELKRLLAFHSIENVGIIVLGLGACLLLRTAGADAWAGVALAAALLHTLNHAVFKSLLFLGAGAFEGRGSLEIDRLGGLLQRMPWTGGAFLVGAMAIAGLPPLNGFASEWLTLQSLLAVPANGGVAAGLTGALALGVLAATAARGALFREGGRARPARPAPPRADRGGRRHAAPDARRRRGARPRLRRARDHPGSPRWAARRARAWPTDDAPSAAARGALGRRAPGPGHLPRPARRDGAPRRGTRPEAAPAPSWACGQLVGPELNGRAPASKPLRLVLEAALRPTGRSRGRSAAASLQEVRYEGHVPHLFDTHLNRPITRVGLWAASHARRVQSGSLTAYVACSLRS